MNEIAFIDIVVSKGKENRVLSQPIRASHKRLYEGIFKKRPVLHDASIEISDAYELLGFGWGYTLMGIKTPSRGVKGGEMAQERIDAIRKKLGKLHEWEFNCKDDWRFVVEAMERFGYTANSYGKKIGKHHSTVMDWYERGLEEYAKLQGWPV